MTTTARTRPIGTVALHFDKGPETWRPAPQLIRESLSGIVQSGRYLWVVSDQTATVESLIADDPDYPTAFSDHRSYQLADFVDLPQDADTEVDLEGIDLQWLHRDAGYLWLIGSHSHARTPVADGATGGKAARPLKRVKLDRNSCVLIRIPLKRNANGRQVLVRDHKVKRGTELTAGVLTGLYKAIADDPHLRDFLPKSGRKRPRPIPGKDNGVDIEGLAVSADRVFVGMRGPVLRGWAIVLELRIQSVADKPQTLRLRRTTNNRPFRKHFLNLGGLGIRELYADGADLLVLAGPTMNLDGPVRLYRWTKGATDPGNGVVPDDRLTVLQKVPHGKRVDHAEGFTQLSRSGQPHLLVVYDSPSKQRQPNKGTVCADLFPWP